MPQTVAPYLMFAFALGIVALMTHTFLANRSANRRLPELGSTGWVALQAGLPDSLENDPALLRYARRVRWWRIGGVLAGWWALPAVWVAVTERPLPSTPLGGFQYAIAGWFVGGLVHDLFVRNRPSAEVRVAPLTPRSPLRYVTATARRWLLASYALTGVAATLAIAIGDPLSWRHDGLLTAATLVLLSVGAFAVRRIAARPHPAADSGDVQVDEAIRAVATTRTVSAWTALQFTLAPSFLPSPLRAGWWFEPTTVVAWLAFVGVLVAWAWVPTRLPARPPTANRAPVAA
ncbi:MAG: hypothetical protein ACR2HP_06020 [Ilumatobacteraceae bacterium]